ncbi:hypothetical protein LTR94_036413, partial [Friedmanniomyces endolithicus]
AWLRGKHWGLGTNVRRKRCRGRRGRRSRTCGEVGDGGFHRCAARRQRMGGDLRRELVLGRCGTTDGEHHLLACRSRRRCRSPLGRRPDLHRTRSNVIL